MVEKEKRIIGRVDLNANKLVIKTYWERNKLNKDKG